MMQIKFKIKRFFGRIIPNKYQWWVKEKQISLTEGPLYYSPTKSRNVKFTFSFCEKVYLNEEVDFKNLAIKKIKNDQVRCYIIEQDDAA